MKNTVSPQKGLTRAGLRSNKDAVIRLNNPKDMVRGVIIQKREHFVHIYTFITWPLNVMGGGVQLI